MGAMGFWKSQWCDGCLPRCKKWPPEDDGDKMKIIIIIIIFTETTPNSCLRMSFSKGDQNPCFRILPYAHFWWKLFRTFHIDLCVVFFLFVSSCCGGFQCRTRCDVWERLPACLYSYWWWGLTVVNEDVGWAPSRWLFCMRVTWGPLFEWPKKENEVTGVMTPYKWSYCL